MFRADVRTTSTFGVISKYAQSWARLGDMLSGRWYNSSITLPSGNLMTMWGRSGGTLTETFNQNTNSWTALSGISLNSSSDPNDNVDDDNHATDPENNLARVEFYNGAIKLTESFSPLPLLRR